MFLQANLLLLEAFVVILEIPVFPEQPGVCAGFGAQVLLQTSNLKLKFPVLADEILRLGLILSLFVRQHLLVPFVSVLEFLFLDLPVFQDHPHCLFQLFVLFLLTLPVACHKFELVKEFIVLLFELDALNDFGLDLVVGLGEFEFEELELLLGLLEVLDDGAVGEVVGDLVVD